MATVDPWTKLSTPFRSRRALRTPSSTPVAKWGGVERHFAWRITPVSASKASRSVNVPPISTATLTFFKSTSLCLFDRDVGPMRGGGKISDFLREYFPQVLRRGGDGVYSKRLPFLLDVRLHQQTADRAA